MKFLNLSDSVNLLSILGAVALFVLSFFVITRLYRQMKVKTNKYETTDEEWDGIREQTNPVPVGWSAVFSLVMLWAIWYFVFGYPLHKYSQVGEYNEEVATYNAKFSEKFKNADHATLKAMGEQYFLVQCSQCHGITGDGISGKAADLTKWGSEDGIVEAIKTGSKGSGYDLGEMPGGMLEGEDAKAVAAYAAAKITAIGKSKNPNLVERGKTLWEENCLACHGESGENEGAPNLKTYGSAAFVVEVLKRGKAGFIGNMPKFSGTGLINDVQANGVGVYVNSLRGE